MKELSVVIVTYNSEPDIYGCLDALFAHNDIGDALEIIVVDNKSPVIMIMNPDVRIIQISLKDIVAQYKEDANLALLGFKQIVNMAGRRGSSFSLLNHYPGFVRLVGGVLANHLDCFCWKHMYFCGACFCVRKGSRTIRRTYIPVWRRE